MTGGRPFLDPRERLEVRRAKERGQAFVYFRDDEGALQIHTLSETESTVLGRTPPSEVLLAWDRQVSGHHAVLERVAGEWIVIDNDSRNGTVVDGRRVVDRRRLHEAALLQLGRTSVVFCDPGRMTSGTEPSDPGFTLLHLSPGQRRVLAALCEPTLRSGSLSAPPSNQEIAARTHMGVETIRTYLRMLYTAFGVQGMVGARKRLRLVHVAVEASVVDLSELEEPPDR
ncbi:MAG: FHA domain-containing protein [Thermoleophilia bacterium]